MSASHMKLLLAALALLLVLAATFAYAESDDGTTAEEETTAEHDDGTTAEHDDGTTAENDDGTTKDGETTHAPKGSDDEDSSDKALSSKCDVEHCETCNTDNESVCEKCEDKFKLDNNNTECKDGVVAPVRAAAVAACVAAVAMLAL